jgi:hypothetical protein
VNMPMHSMSCVKTYVHAHDMYVAGQQNAPTITRENTRISRHYLDPSVEAQRWVADQLAVTVRLGLSFISLTRSLSECSDEKRNVKEEAGLILLWAFK